MTKKKVIVFVDLKKTGGVETVFSEMLPFLAKNYNLFIVSKDKIPNLFQTVFLKLQVKSISANSVKFRIFNIFSYFLYKIKLKYLIPQKIDKFIPDLMVDFKDGAFYKFRRVKISSPKILWIHQGWNAVKENKKLDFRFYDKIVVLTKSLKSKLSSVYPEYKNKFVSIYNPVDFERILKLSKIERKDDLKDYFCSVCRLTKDKDIKTLIDAFDIFKKKVKSLTKLVIIGDGCEKYNFTEYAKSKSSYNDILFLGNKENPYPYMKDAKAVILSSPSEGLGMVLIEALICSNGVVVSSDCPNGPKEVLMDGKSGALFPVGDYQKLSDILLDIENKKITRNSFSSFIPENLQRFSKEKIEKECLDLFNSLIKESKDE